MFALSSTALLMLTGVAVDLSRAVRAEADLQNAADSAVLAIARDVEATTTIDWIKTHAAQRMSAMLPETYDFEIVSAARTGSIVTIDAVGSMPTGISAALGVSRIDQKVTSEALWGTGKLEVALVLDNTGSMGQLNRMTELKKAANALLAELEAAEPGLVKVAIVPFDVNVRVPSSYKTASWFKADWWTSWFWKGCLTDRDQPNDVSDVAVTSTATKYPGAICSKDSLATILPLTSNFTDLYSKVTAMTPAGNTNITIGLAWGLTTLSPQEPYTQGVAWGTKDVSKIIVLMTDGDNTENRWTQTASSIDARTRLACQSVKDAGVTLYTVRLVEGNAALLRDCASRTDTFYDVENVADLVPAFQAIGEELTELRLSR
jgi:Flp pilus assembly protein TadG